MAKLEKAECQGIFSEYYEGYNGNKKVVCILNDNCVRYTVLVRRNLGYKKVSRREYSNEKKAMCFRNAELALNK